MTTPTLFFSYGMTKSGSTLGFRLACAILEAAGFPQILFPNGRYGRNIRKSERVNFVNDLDEADVSAMSEWTRDVGYPIVFKCHARPSEAVQVAFKKGTAFGHAIYRDPRDLALSMMDAGKRAQETGAAAFSEITDLNAALKGIRNQTESLAMWLRLPGVVPFDYAQIAFDSITSAKRMARQFGLDVDAEKVVARAKSQFTQFNLGIKSRYLREMDEDTADVIAKEWAPMFETLFSADQKFDGEAPFLKSDTALRDNTIEQPIGEKL